MFVCVGRIVNDVCLTFCLMALRCLMECGTSTQSRLHRKDPPPFCIFYDLLFNSIQFKALFRVDINHTYNTSSNELLKSTMVYNNTYNHAYKHIK